MSSAIPASSAPRVNLNRSQLEFALMPSPPDEPLPVPQTKHVTDPEARQAVWSSLEAQLEVPRSQIGIIVVDHGSRVERSNELLLEFVAMFARVAPVDIVEPAHMELAEPSIATAVRRCAERGARLLVVSPFFLLPGKHWQEDLPRLVGEAAAAIGDLRWIVAAPLGLHPLLPEVMLQRIEHCAQHAFHTAPRCDVCAEGPRDCEPT